MKKKFLCLFLFVILGVAGFAQDGYVDLGLPSGTKWRNVNAKGKYTYYEAMELYGDKLPSYEQWVELERECEWKWVVGASAEKTGCKVTGPNGRSIFLPAAGFTSDLKSFDKGKYGGYWSSMYYGEQYSYSPISQSMAVGMAFSESGTVIGQFSCPTSLSIRLVKD